MANYEQLLIGPIYTLNTNTTTGNIYAMPARSVLVFVQPSGGTLTTGATATGAFSTVTLTNNQFESSAPFLQNSTTATVVRLAAL